MNDPIQNHGGTVARIADIIEAHMPLFSAAPGVALGHAHSLLMAVDRPGAYSGTVIGANLQGLEDLARALGDVERHVFKLAPELLQALDEELRWTIQGAGLQEAHNWRAELVRALSAIVLFQTAATETLKSAKRRKLVANKRDYRLVVAVDQARMIWGDYLWRATGQPTPVNFLALIAGDVDPALTSRELHKRYDSFRRTEPPRFDKPGNPGPFGRFLEEVLFELGFSGEGELGLTASSALRTWRDAGIHIR